MHHEGRHARLRCAACLTVIFAASAAPQPCGAARPAGALDGAPADAARRQRFDIPAGNAALRLNELFARLGLTLACDFKATGVSTTNAVRGVYSLEEALHRMVAGRNIEFWFPNGRTVSCGPRTRPEAVAGVEPTARRAPAAEAPMQQVTVTGTQPREIAHGAAQVITFTREDIERSGAGTLQELLRTLPQNFDGGPTEDTREIGRETRTNSGIGTAMNLRGIGPAETLVLLNGRRLAPGGSEGAFIDISSIPLTAIERIDVLPDSGSVVYGTDAIGGVINVILRSSPQNETRVRGGTATRGGPVEQRAGQTLGAQGPRGSAMFAFEYYHRGALPASDRALAASDLRAHGGDNFDTLQSSPGNVLAGGQLWAIPRGQDGTSLTPQDFTPGSPHLENRQKNADLLASQQRWSAVATARRTIGDGGALLFADALLSRRNAEQRYPGLRMDLPVTASNPFFVNPAGGNEPVVVSYDFIDDLGPLIARPQVDTAHLTAGTELPLGEKWRLSAHTSWANEELDFHQENQANLHALGAALLDPDATTAFNPFGDGSHTNPATLAGIRARSRFEVVSSIAAANLKVDGPVASLPGGDAKLALGVDHRRQRFNSRLRYGAFGTHSSTHSHREISSAFGELSAPLTPDLELSLALRHEGYSDVPGTSAPRAGLRWSLSPDVALRTTWARSYRPPNLADLDESGNGSQLVALADSASPSGYTPTLVWFGRNADLVPESAHAWTLGIDLGGPRLAGWRLSLTYFDVRLTNEFAEYALPLNVLDDPRFAGFVDREPDAAQREAVCARSHFAGFGNDCLEAPIGALVDFRLSNSAYRVTRGLDLSSRRRMDTGLGTLEAGIDGTYGLRYGRRETGRSPMLDLLDTQNNPLRLHLRGTLSWQRGALGATAALNHDGGYRDTASEPRRSVSSLTTVDLQLRHEREGLRFSLSAQNVFDRDPPFLNNPLGIGYDAENADLLGRTLSLEALKAW
jgi:iron complex outermembrane receptor protein